MYHFSVYGGVGFPGGSEGKESVPTVGDPDLIPGSGRYPGEGNDNQFQYSCLKRSLLQSMGLQIVIQD